MPLSRLIIEALVTAAVSIQGEVSATKEASPACAKAELSVPQKEFVMPIMRCVASDCFEILDPRECEHFLVKAEDFEKHVAILRDRYVALMDAPREADAKRLPDRSTIDDFRKFSVANLRYWEMQWPLENSPAVDLHTLQCESKELYRIWDIAYNARCKAYYNWVRRAALKELRDILGDDDYYNGNLPPYVPIWRFKNLNGPQEAPPQVRGNERMWQAYMREQREALQMGNQQGHRRKKRPFKPKKLPKNDPWRQKGESGRIAA